MLLQHARKTVARQINVFALALGALGVVALAPGADAQTVHYPVDSISYRKRLDDAIKMMRKGCDAHCPPKDRARIVAGIDRMASRVVDVCADGWVTAAENDYVWQAKPPSE